MVPIEFLRPTAVKSVASTLATASKKKTTARSLKIIRLALFITFSKLTSTQLWQPDRFVLLHLDRLMLVFISKFDADDKLRCSAATSLNYRNIPSLLEPGGKHIDRQYLYVLRCDIRPYADSFVTLSRCFANRYVAMCE